MQNGTEVNICLFVLYTWQQQLSSAVDHLFYARSSAELMRMSLDCTDLPGYPGQFIKMPLGLVAGQSASQTHPSMGNACAFFTISSSRDPLLSLQVSSGDPHFHARPRSGDSPPPPPPIFHFAAAHTYQNVG